VIGEWLIGAGGLSGDKRILFYWLPRQNALVGFFDVAQFERVAVRFFGHRVHREHREN